MKLNDFVNKYLGKATEYSTSDAVLTVQCVDLIKLYLKELFGISPKSFAWGNAKDYFNCFDYKSWAGYDLMHGKGFVKIKNTKAFVPRRGDIAVWGSGQYGHIAICTGKGDTKSFYSYDQNWSGKEMKMVKHDYSGFLGVLRPPREIKSDVNIRTGPGISYDIVGEKLKGETVTVLEFSSNGKWAKIGDNKWISNNYILPL